MAPKIGVLALQGDVREHARALAACGADVASVRRPEDLRGLDGIVLPGGESTTMSKLLDFQGLLEPLRALISEGFPAYGSCAGMILLANKVLDGRPDQHSLNGIDMVVRRNAFGSQVDSFEADIEASAFGTEPLHAVFIRAPWVESVGPLAQVLAAIPVGNGPDRIVAVAHGNCLATSFHPEITSDTRVHEYFIRMIEGRS